MTTAEFFFDAIRRVVDATRVSRFVLETSPGPHRCWRCSQWESGVACGVTLLLPDGRAVNTRTSAVTECVFDDPDSPPVTLGNPELEAARKRLANALALPERFQQTKSL